MPVFLLVEVLLKVSTGSRWLKVIRLFLYKLLLVSTLDFIDYVDQKLLLAPYDINLLVDSLLFVNNRHFELVTISDLLISVRPMFLLNLLIHEFPFLELLFIISQLVAHYAQLL